MTAAGGTPGGSATPGKPSRALTPGRRAALIAAAACFLLHAATLLWTWRGWGLLGRRNVLTWVDFPISLAYLARAPGELLLWSLLLGGLQWALLGGLLTLLIGRSAR
jgi:hypothetical protein